MKIRGHTRLDKSSTDTRDDGKNLLDYVTRRSTYLRRDLPSEVLRAQRQRLENESSNPNFVGEDWGVSNMPGTESAGKGRAVAETPEQALRRGAPLARGGQLLPAG